MCSRAALPPLVISENSTGCPAASRSPPVCCVNPSLVSAFIAALSSYRSGFNDALNQNLFAGDTGPAEGCARPPYTTRAISSRLIARLTAWRNAADWNHFRFHAGSDPPGDSLNHMDSESIDGPRECAEPGFAF